MAGVRRRLRDVGSRVSGVLGALRDEVVPEVLGGRPAEPQEPSPDPQADGEHEAQEHGAEEHGAVQSQGPAAQDGAQDEPRRGPQDEQPQHEQPQDGVAVSDTGAVTPTPTDEQPTEVGADAPATPVLDEVCAAAVDLARAAAVEEAGARVGEHLGVEPEDPHTVTHAFATTDPAYRGWRWAVTVARAAGTDTVTVDEVVLLPGADALLAPAWVPYSERVQPEDLGTGDLLPSSPDDPRLVPSYADTEDDQALREELRWELGLGRARVLSQEGRLEAADRWQQGETGPTSARALAAPGACGDCGFLVPLAGSLRAAFGVCANAQAPDDGRVVSLLHGCGAHSEIPAEVGRLPVAELVVDEVEFEFEERGQGRSEQPADEPAQPQAPADPLPDPADEGQAEELGHS